jgi:hypothetical protein
MLVRYDRASQSIALRTKVTHLILRKPASFQWATLVVRFVKSSHRPCAAIRCMRVKVVKLQSTSQSLSNWYTYRIAACIHDPTTSSSSPWVSSPSRVGSSIFSGSFHPVPACTSATTTASATALKNNALNALS